MLDMLRESLSSIDDATIVVRGQFIHRAICTIEVSRRDMTLMSAKFDDDVHCTC